MKINTLQLINFRNYDHTALSFDHMVNIFYGKNGQGKTNLLESIFYAAFGLSHRTSNGEDMVKFSAEGMAVAVSFTKRDGSHDLRLKRFFDQGKLRKEIKADGKKITAREHYGYLNAVMFSPEDLQIVKGEPALRRRYLDMEIAQTDPLYYDLLLRYKRTLQQRNFLLKEIREKRQEQTVLSVWDKELAGLNAALLTKRLATIEKLKRISYAIFSSLSQQADSLRLRYEMKANHGVLLYPEQESEKELVKFFLDLLQERRFKDITLGTTGIGIHRDDLKAEINGLDSKAFASQGQQRCCALALKMSQIEYVKEVFDEYPILLLDDVMSELDQYRRKQLVGFINDKVQTFITVNDRQLIPEFDSNQYFKIEQGSVCEDSYG